MPTESSPRPLMIGILGGMGPQAGFDLASVITAETRASRDQDHLPLIVWSHPGVPDRTAWLSDRSAPDPAPAMVDGFLALERAGAGVAGMACNTAHTPALFDRVRHALGHAGARIRILHLIEETVAGIRSAHP
ncbi:MAG: aspartate/glutamate racemase family protein, partial [Bacteroidetes bacterium]|nr:aspartate/glutamate racemase family protein [Bacteroidota bacterium]